MRTPRVSPAQRTDRSSKGAGATALVARNEFTDLGDCAYFYTGAHAPALTGVTERLVWGHRCQSDGAAGRLALMEAEARTREAVGRLVNAAAADVAFVGDASTAWNAVAGGLEWRPGDNVVLNEFEHPSVLYPWLRLKSKGLEVRVVPRDSDWRIDAPAIEESCDRNTRAVALSQVGYVSGFRHDIGAVSAVADRVGAPLFLDVSHALGVVPVDLGQCSIAVSASYKWLLGPYGVGIVLWNRDRLPGFQPGSIGWRSTDDIFTDARFERVDTSCDAGRFQLGAPSFAGIAGLGAAVDRLTRIGVEEIERHASALADRAIEILGEFDLTVITPRDPNARAGNVAFLHPACERLGDALASRGVFVWAGDGRVRLSLHVMNSLDDLERFRTALSDALIEAARHDRST